MMEYESFEPSTGISSTCAYLCNVERGNCPVSMKLDPVFALFGNDCGGLPVAPGTDDPFCYHVPADDEAVFSS